MKFAVVILTVVAAASAQYIQPLGAYNPGVYNPGAYKPFVRKQYPTPIPFRQYVSSTPAPFAPTTFAPIAPTFAPIAPTYAPVVPKTIYNGDDRNANIVRYDNQVNPDGSYAYSYENDNGIAAQESGVFKAVSPNEGAVVATGSYRFVSPEGAAIEISYTADENGFQPIGNAIPTSPPIPEAILRSLAYIAANPPKSQ